MHLYKIMQRSTLPFFIQFSSVVTSSKTIVQYHSQDIDSDLVKIQNIPITTMISLNSCPYPLLNFFYIFKD